jgi:hypothetical protein
VNSLTRPFSEGGVPYCPEVATGFLIVAHDVAVQSISLDPASVFAGEVVSVDVIVANLGSESESFYVTVFYNRTTLGVARVTNMTPFSTETVRFDWNTSGAVEGLYQISAMVDMVPDEIDVSDNSLDDGFVEVKAKLPPFNHDVAVVDVIPFNATVYVGEIALVEVTVANNGDFSESFNVALFYNSSAMGILPIENLGSGANRTTVFYWNTQGVGEGRYVLTANASQVLGETNVENNAHVDGSVEVKARLPPVPVHDIEVLNVVPSVSMVYIGVVVEVDVTVWNKGNATESFNVLLRHDQNVAGILSIHNLPSGAQRTLTFDWNTSGVPNGNYRLSAYAEPVQDEENTADNTYLDGYVEIVSPAGDYFGFDWFYLVLLLLLIVLVVMIILLSYYRGRNRKKSQKVFASGWTAWFYGYDLHHKPSSTSGSKMIYFDEDKSDR